MKRELRETALWMLQELLENKHRVELVPIPDSRKIRAVIEPSPIWYSEFCAEYPPSRSKPRSGKRGDTDTKIKRSDTIRALKELASGKCQSLYAERLYPVVLAEHCRITGRQIKSTRKQKNEEIPGW